MSLTAWAVTTGEAGMRTQARGLAAAVADVVVEFTVPGALPWPWPAPAIRAPLAPPLPDIMITCGRRAAPHALAVKRASGGRTLIVHVQDPRAGRAAFDLIVAMDHDRIAAGGRVVKVATALHDLTPAALAEAARAWQARFDALPRPVTGVTIGGDLKGRAFTLSDGERLIAGLRLARAEGGLAITPSRRTPPAVRRALQEAFGRDSAVILGDPEGDNPYRAILALSDRLVTTSDSVSMVSEAIFTALPVDVLDLGFGRHEDFIQSLVDVGRIRRFGGDPAPLAVHAPIDATGTAAAAVRALLQGRTGVSG